MQLVEQSNLKSVTELISTIKWCKTPFFCILYKVHKIPDIKELAENEKG